MPDLIPNAGLAIATNLLSGLGGTVPSYVGWGTGTTAPAAGNTGLETPATEARVNGTISRVTTTVTNDTVQNVATITADGSKTISEVAQFDGAGSGSPPTGANIFTRSTFTGLPLAAADSITFTLKTKVENA